MTRGRLLVGGYLTVYAAALLFLVRRGESGVAEPLFILAVMGGVFSFGAWLLTRHVKLLPVEVGAVAPAVAYLAVVGVFATWGLGAIPTRQPLHDILAMVAKLVVFVAIPMALFPTRLTLRFTRRDLFITVVFALALCGLQVVAGSGMRRIAAAHLGGAPLIAAAIGTFVWYSIEAGLVEEYFFRAVLQTRLEKAFRSPAGGIVVAALLFGLVHAPGIFLRTARTHEALTQPSLLTACAYTVIILSASGIGFGVLWTRTRNLIVLAVVHGATDLVPNLADFAISFGIR